MTTKLGYFRPGWPQCTGSTGMYWNVLEKILYWNIYWESVILVLEKHVYWKNYFKKGKCTGMYWKIEKVALNFFPVYFFPALSV